MLHIGFNNYAAIEKIVSIVEGKAVKDGLRKTISAPTRRAISEAKNSGRAIDATTGRGTRSVLFMSDGQVILSSVSPEALMGRLKDQGGD